MRQKKSVGFERLQRLLLQRPLTFPVYEDISCTAERFLVDNGSRIDAEENKSDDVLEYFCERWLFGDPNRLPFRWTHGTNDQISSLSARLRLHEFSQPLRTIRPLEHFEVPTVSIGLQQEKSGQPLDRM
jgi:hypothetical protein